MIFGPVLGRELETAPRRRRWYLMRALYPMVLLLLMCTAWLVLAGAQEIRNIGDMARFGTLLFQILAPLQLVVVLFVAAVSVAVGVAQEKDRRTLDLLLMTRLRNHEIVLGKLAAGLLHVLVLLTSGLPIFACLVLLGGVSFAQIGQSYLVTIIAAVVAGSVGGSIAFSRDKTFQSLAMTVLALVLWLGLCEALAGGRDASASSAPHWASWAHALSPIRAVLESARPTSGGEGLIRWLTSSAHFIGVALGTTALVNGLAIAFLRRWCLVREGARSGPARRLEESQQAANAAAVASPSIRPSRQVWRNPILWREICTWAYGRRLIVIRSVYWLLFLMSAIALVRMAASGDLIATRAQTGTIIPTTTLVLAPFILVSLLIVNALAVNSIANERDGRSLDLLLVTDVSPLEFIGGKLGGIFWITREMVLMPLLLLVYLWWERGISGESLVYLLGGLLVMNGFVATLGLHCGMTHAHSRTAIGISLGTVFFLFLGISVGIMMMVSFSGSFQLQFLPFSAFILGGSVGLFSALGLRNPSHAILLASILLPFATFHAMTSFLLDSPLAVFLVSTAAYGFATAAMLIPAIHEFDFAQGRGTAADGDHSALPS